MICVSLKINESVIEYVDAEEQLYSMVAMNHKKMIDPTSNEKYNYTHSEIHPSTIFGVLVSCIPFPQHNQSRNTYQCAMVLIGICIEFQ